MKKRTRPNKFLKNISLYFNSDPAMHTWMRRIRLLSILLFCYHYAYLHNIIFQPGSLLTAVLFLVWFLLSYGLHLKRFLGYLKFAWPLLIWTAQIYARRLLEPAMYDPSRYALQICLLTAITFWYANEGSRQQVSCLVFTSMFGFFHASVKTILVSRSKGLPIRSLASVPVEQSDGAGGLGSVYLMLYIVLLIGFYFIVKKCHVKERLLLTALFLVGLLLMALSQYVLLYLLCLAVAFLLFLFSARHPLKRFLIAILVVAILYWPFAKFLLFLAGKNMPQVLQVRFEELGKLMLWDFSYSQGHSAFLGRFTRFFDAAQIFINRPLFGGFGRQMWFSFHHDFQWVGDLAISGLPALLFFYFIFQKFRSFLQKLSDNHYYRRMIVMFFILLFLHGTCNRLYAGDLLYTIFTFMPLAMLYYFQLEPVAMASGYIPGRTLKSRLGVLLSDLDG